MLRARQTALPLARALNLDLQIVPALHERKVGILSGKPWSSDNIWPITLDHWTSGDTPYAHENAESYDDIQTRILPEWDRLTTQHRDRTFVLVAHGIVCRILLLSILPGYGPSQWGQISTPNAGISELVREGETWEALSLGKQPEELREMGLT